LKAEAIAKNHSEAIVIGMDSVGCLNGQILEKPKSSSFSGIVIFGRLSFLFMGRGAVFLK